MKTSFNDFTKIELQTLLDAIYFRLMDCRMFVKSAKEIYEQSGCSDYVAFMEFQDIKSKITEIETLELFRVQVLNAIGQVGLIEEIHSN